MLTDSRLTRRWPMIFFRPMRKSLVVQAVLFWWSATYSFATQFEIVEGNFTWQEAKADAEARGGRLAVLDTQQKIDNANAYLNEIDFRGQAFIGLTDEEEEGVWRWIDGTPLTASNWGGGEPNNVGDEDYVYIREDRQWNDTRSITVVTYYLLERVLTQFQIIEGNFTWHEAKADAEAKGGRLAVLDTQEKIDAANAYLEELGEWPNLWIGATDEVNEGDWRWIDGNNVTEDNWGPLNPSNNFNGNPENFAHIWRSNDNRRLQWNDAVGNLNTYRNYAPVAYLLEIIPSDPAPPLVQLDALYESPSGEAITIDATPIAGFPAEFTYQWRFNGFTIPASLGGAESAINIDNLPDNEGTWSVTVTNETGSVEQSFEYRIYADSDSDGLSDAYEALISMSDINNPDTDGDGLRDAEEVNDHRTNPNSPDTDSDGFTDAYELQTAYDPNSADSAPDAQVGIMTAIEVSFNAALGATYDIQFSTDTVDWTVIEADIVGEGNAVERLYSKKDFPTGFFRVERTDQ